MELRQLRYFVRVVELGSISRAAADYQLARVARARGMSDADMRTLIDRYTDGAWIGFIGEPRVNVLLLNLALDSGPAKR